MTRKLFVLISASVLLALAAIGLAAQGKPATAGKPSAAHAAPAMTVWTSDQGQWVEMSTGAKMKVVLAAPGKAPTDLYIWRRGGTDSPLHWHSSDERSYVVAGDQQFRMFKGKDSPVMHPGSFVLTPARMIHQARCVSKQDCYILVHTTLPFDVNIVDENGKPIPPPKPAAKK